MVDFWLQNWHEISTESKQADWLAFAAFMFWLWLIWPTHQLKSLLVDRELRQRFFIAATFIIGLWLLNANVMQGMHAHFLGLVSISMMFGWRLTSILVLPCSLFFSTFIIKQPAVFGAYSLIAMLLPIFLSYLFYIQSYKYLPKHLFIFIFFGGFFNAALMMASHISLWSLWLWATQQYSWSVLVDNYLVLIPLLGFPEALLNGMAITLLVVYRPHWLYDYSDKQYLWRKP